MLMFAISFMLLSSLNLMANSAVLGPKNSMTLAESTAQYNPKYDQGLTEPVLTQDNKWGWDLRKYKSIGSAYLLKGG